MGTRYAPIHGRAKSLYRSCASFAALTSPCFASAGEEEERARSSERREGEKGPETTRGLMCVGEEDEERGCVDARRAIVSWVEDMFEGVWRRQS